MAALVTFRFVTKTLNRTLQRGLASDFFESSKHNYHLRESDDCLLLSADRKTFIAWHPPVDVQLSRTKPVREVPVANTRTLSDDEKQMVRDLQTKDNRVWTSAVLAQLFDVDKSRITELMPISKAEWERRMTEKQKELEFVRALSPFLKIRFYKQKQQVRQLRLKAAIASLDYKFPGKLSESMFGDAGK